VRVTLLHASRGIPPLVPSRSDRHLQQASRAGKTGIDEDRGVDSLRSGGGSVVGLDEQSQRCEPEAGERGGGREGVRKRVEVVLVSYESLRSMHRQSLAFCNASVALCTPDVEGAEEEEDGSGGGRAAVDGGEGVETAAQLDVGEGHDEGGGAGGGNGRTRRHGPTGVRGQKRPVNEPAKAGVQGGKEWSKARSMSAIFQGRWWRVVLDEAHVIKNRHSLTFRACLALQAQHRWCLTGTPLQNSADDVQPLMAFLRVAPLADHAVWQQYVGKPIRLGDALGLARLRVALRAVSLRRSNAVLASSLPPITVLTHSVRMDGEERRVYDLLFASARAAFMALDAHGDVAVMQQYTSVLECLLRLRQACSSGSIIPAARLARARQVLQRLTGSDDPYAVPQLQDASSKHGSPQEREPVIKAKLTVEEAAKILKTLTAIQEAQQGEEYTCAVCLDDLTEAAARRVLRVCAHAFCADCVERLVADAEEAKREREGSAGAGGGAGASASCPLCRAPFTSADIFSAPEISNASSADVPVPVPNEGGAGEELGGDAETIDRPAHENSLESSVVGVADAGAGGQEEGEGIQSGESEEDVERAESGGRSVSPKIHALIADLEEANEHAGAQGRRANLSSTESGGEDCGAGRGRTAAEEGCAGADGSRRGIKAVVFSQFLGCLDEVGAALARTGHAFGRLQGNLSLEQRREVLMS